VKTNFKYRKALYLTCTFLEAIAVTTSNRIKSRLGIKPKPSSTANFLRLFLRHALGRQSELRITCKDRTDGAGAQAHTIMSAINFARACGHTYAHTPFAEIDHGDRPIEQWVEDWENLFNLGEGDPGVSPDDRTVINYSSFHPRLFHAVGRSFQRMGSKTQKNEKSSGDEFFFHPFFYYSDSSPDSYHSVIPELRKKYYSNKSPSKNDVITVAVHMRRGDVTAKDHRRFTPIAAVCETTRLVKSILEKHNQDYKIALYSQGKASYFEELQEAGAELCLDIDAIWTMQQLIEADILIMSKSSFSYVAALISDGIKLYDPFWHPPLSNWLGRNPKGKFNATTFEAQLKNSGLF
jgi:hypothetical protein